mmetsp:Transcript_9208/g.18553  ORF Transcript_9208/g.18553 Transcript_9208/m.18553 type:complete len:259 (+) Transcript_9208:323-1099(+)
MRGERAPPPTKSTVPTRLFTRLPLLFPPTRSLPACSLSQNSLRALMAGSVRACKAGAATFSSTLRLTAASRCKGCMVAKSTLMKGRFTTVCVLVLRLKHASSADWCSRCNAKGSARRSNEDGGAEPPAPPPFCFSLLFGGPLANSFARCSTSASATKSAPALLELADDTARGSPQRGSPCSSAGTVSTVACTKRAPTSTTRKGPSGSLPVSKTPVSSAASTAAFESSMLPTTTAPSSHPSSSSASSTPPFPALAAGEA